MKFLPLIWAMLWRSRARTLLTLSSIAVAFLLFGLLQAVAAAFEAGVRVGGVDRLVVTARFGPTKPLPQGHRSRIEAVPGIVAVSPTFWFGGWYQEPKNAIQSYALDPRAAFAVDARLIATPEHRQAFADTRTGVLVGRDLAARKGWKVGDRIPINTYWPRKDGSRTWEFDIVGLYDLDRNLVGRGIEASAVLLHFDYFVEECPVIKGMVGWYFARIQDPAQATAVSAAIDALFRNSRYETKTQTEQEFNLSFAKQIGDGGLILRAILSAVFFTLLLVATNTMMQAFRERIPELAVLKTVGYGDGQVAALIVVESLLLVVGAGVAGLGLAGLAVPPAASAMAQLLPGMTLLADAVLAGLALATAVALVAAAVPAWQARRLTVVEALAASY